MKLITAYCKAVDMSYSKMAYAVDSFVRNVFMGDSSLCQFEATLLKPLEAMYCSLLTRFYFKMSGQRVHACAVLQYCLGNIYVLVHILPRH